MPSWLLSAFAVAPNLLGLVGSVALVVPALRLNKIAKLRAKVSKMVLSEDDDLALHELKKDLERELGMQQSQWSRRDEFFLIGGICAIVASYLLNLFAPT